jgi:hypothetical protein
MVRVKQTPKRKHRKKMSPALGAAGVAGMSVAIAGGASANAAPAPVSLDSLFTHPPIVLGEEEIADVSLATFYVFDKENADIPEAGVQLARGCGGCGCRGCGGCRGCAVRGCGGCRAIACRGCGCRACRGCRGCGCGGWWGCGGCGCGCCLAIGPLLVC